MQAKRKVRFILTGKHHSYIAKIFKHVRITMECIVGPWKKSKGRKTTKFKQIDQQRSSVNTTANIKKDQG